jgi:RNA polymerase-interacting CarD/CdnL/TRCF family regulator
MNYQVGDQVMHWNYGLGEIIQMDEKVLSGQKTRCYVVKIRDLTLWVPIGETGKCSLRPPTPRSEFEAFFKILRSPGEPLPQDRYERKNQLQETLKDGKLEGVCRVVRDLYSYSRTKKLNDYDKAILTRAQDYLFSEWRQSLSISLAQAELELGRMLAR